MNLLQQRALNHIWFPCSQMKDYQALPPLDVVSAKGSYLYLRDGSNVIDAISSWWCKSLGHQHPEIKQALINQLDSFEHVIGTNTTNATLVELSEKLASLHPNLKKVFYGGDGSMAVEIALKMSIHVRKVLNQPQRQHFISLSNSYHGETLATLSVSDVGMYKDPYRDFCFECIHLNDIPYVSTANDPLWHDASSFWPAIKKQLDPYKDTATAILVEPLLQGAGGMKVYSANFLQALADYAKAHDIHLICDEIMTGFGRTGTTLAIDQTTISPDFICLSKGLTGGTLAMSAVLTTNDIYDLFYGDYQASKTFLHSNTYCGNALAASVANTVLDIHFRDNINQQALVLGQWLAEGMHYVAQQSQTLTHFRQLGAMVAMDLIDPTPRAGFKLFIEALHHGVFLRPLGNTLYWLPPLNTPKAVVEELIERTLKAIVSYREK